MVKNIFSFCLILVLLSLFSLYGDGYRRKGQCFWVYHKNSNCPRSTFPCGNGECIDRRLFCNGRNDCGDNSDEKYCGSVSTCPSTAEMRQCITYRKCIPEKWFCDGIPDCPNGKDEENCEGRKDNEEKLKEKALQWLFKQNSQSSIERWGPFVDKLSVAFYLANNTWTIKGNQTRKEMAYEVSIKLLSQLSKKKLRKIPSSDLASYINSFLVTCLNPRKFHGLDIVQELRSRVDNQNYTNPYLLLSLCNAGENITDLDKMKLADAFHVKHREFWTDVQAVAIMALACANKQPRNGVDPETLHKLTLQLKQRQSVNGTVENLQTTALVMQALLAAEPDSDSKNFDENKALQRIFAMQKLDGSFGSLLDTYYVLPVLNCKSLVNISSDHCESSRKDELSALDDLITRGGPKIRVRYSLWIENKKNLERTLALLVPVNMSLYGIMGMAGDIDSRFRFEYVVKNGKPYVYALSGLKDNPEMGKFWFLYTMEEGILTPAEDSPVDVIPNENKHFVMWYRSGSWVQ